ncbi:MAG TPA: hypothetical protein VF669_08350 [Tepidisphaeraceae bacterium]
MRRALHLILLMLLGCASSASADTRCEVQVGWGNVYRAMRWNPVFVTLSDPTPRSVILEIQSPYDRRYGMRIIQNLTIGPTPVTVPIYLPLSWNLDSTTFTVATAGGRSLAHVTAAENPIYRRTPGQDPTGVGYDQLFVGIGGSSSSERLLESQLRALSIVSGFLPQSHLPAVPAGYDALDLLILNTPDLSRIAEDQQRAIVSWVRGGGNLILLPGPEPLPATSPLIDALPCRIGQTQTIQLDPRIVKNANLPSRFASLTTRQLTPLPGAVETKLFTSITYSSSTRNTTQPTTQFAPQPLAYRGRAGYGQILVLPTDVSTFQFTGTKADAFWKRLLEGLVQIPASDPNNSGNVARPWFNGSGADVREQAALSWAMEHTGNIPGAGTFGFSYIAGVLILMMVLVGPVDWFVLKLTKRQPWTWMTTAGWAGLITLGAIFVGHLFKSGELYFNTVSVIDEADGSRVAATNLVAIYSPKTTEYELEQDPESWWKPASEQVAWSSSGIQIDIPCHQDYHGNRLLPLPLNVWNLRFVEGATYATENALIETNLSVKHDPELKKKAVTGTITNRSNLTLKNIIIRTDEGVTHVAKSDLAPNETAVVKVAFDPKDKQFQTWQSNGPQRYWNQNTAHANSTTVAAASDLAAGRSGDIEKLIKKYKDTACVYAEYDAPPATVNLVQQAPRQHHIGVLRSLVHVQR